jgi:hypothetical protein
MRKQRLALHLLAAVVFGAVCPTAAESVWLAHFCTKLHTFSPFFHPSILHICTPFCVPPLPDWLGDVRSAASENRKRTPRSRTAPSSLVHGALARKGLSGHDLRRWEFMSIFATGAIRASNTVVWQHRPGKSAAHVSRTIQQRTTPGTAHRLRDVPALVRGISLAVNCCRHMVYASGRRLLI